MELVRPFVYRRHLDYNAFAALRDLHRQIRREVERRDIADNIKLGPGGIREIEFIAQVFQLIRGGREPDAEDASPPSPCCRCSRSAICCRRARCRSSTEAYVFLRNLEHRLQYLDDQQTHVLPRVGSRPRAHRARRWASPTTPRSRRRSRQHRAARDAPFRGHLRRVARTPSMRSRTCGRRPPDAEQSVAALARARLPRARRRSSSVCGACARRSRYREMPAASQARLDRLVPLAIEAAAAEQGPGRDARAPARPAREQCSRRGSYLALLVEYPQALSQLAAMMSASPWVAQYLTSHPILLDELLDTRTLYAAPDWPAAARAAARADGRRRRRHREADGRPAALQARAHHAADRAGPGGPAAARDTERPPERSRRAWSWRKCCASPGRLRHGAPRRRRASR